MQPELALKVVPSKAPPLPRRARPRKHPKTVGDITQAKVIAALIEVYDDVLIPFGENTRYDLVVDDRGRFLRIQCKTGRLRSGAILFAACSFTYLVPVDDVGLRQGVLRVTPPRNNQYKKIRWAADFEVKPG